MEQLLALLVGLCGMFIGTSYQRSLEPTNRRWVLLIAGSKGIDNYRHQADVCHSYHLMIAQGIQADRIVVMMYDDVANDKQNPWPGKLFNKPNGTDVYAGVKIDYRGKDVSPPNSLNVLKGNKTAMKGIGTGRVIESDDSNIIFVYFSGHGVRGGLCFPSDNCASVLYADELHRTLNEMSEAQNYYSIIMYIEACFSGALFENLLKTNRSVFAMTAAARDEYSYPVYCIDAPHLPGGYIALGDEFSTRWMERMDQATYEGVGAFEFFDQYQELRTAVRLSHVEMYGDFSIGTSALSDNNFVIRRHSPEKNTLQPSQPNTTTIPCNFEEIQDEETKVYDGLLEALSTKATFDYPHYRATVKRGNLPLNLNMFSCYKNLIANFRHDCKVDEHEYLLDFYDELANICVLELNTSMLLREMPALCSFHLALLN
uniref:Legumain n=2 Tax=Lygus hesperus TaxID=30085 RepID=A0A0A9YP53_LYGHE